MAHHSAQAHNYNLVTNCLLRQLRMSLETGTETKGGGGERKWFTGTSLARGINTLLEFSGQLFHWDAPCFTKTPKVHSAFQIYHNASPFSIRPCGNRDAGLSLICWGFRAADEAVLKHNPEDQPGQPMLLCRGDTRYAALLCQGGLWVRKRVIGKGGKLCQCQQWVTSGNPQRCRWF